MKVVLIGGGSFVFAPTVLEDAIVKHKLSGKLVLVDVNKEIVEAMAGAGRRVARELKVPLEIEATIDREEALIGADYVIVSASPQGAQRWLTDFNILTEHGLSDQARECGGIGGLLNTFRSVTLILDICRDMEKLCPDAILLDVTNPMPRVVTAIERYSNIKGIGFCNIAFRGPKSYEFLASLVNRSGDEIAVETAGLNHFAWVMSMMDKQTGESLLPQLIDVLVKANWGKYDSETKRELGIMREWYNLYGAVPAGAVDHHAEYLPYRENIHYTTSPPYHGTAKERQERLQELLNIADGKLDWQRLFINPSWEHPIDLAVALQQGNYVELPILNVRNNYAIPQLPQDRIVEVPVTVESGVVKPKVVPPFSQQLAELIHQISDIHEFSVKAAFTGDKEWVKLAVELDPAITQKETAHIVVEKMLKAHTDLLPQFQ
ncbi:hypothetical protein [Paenibacillus illinoisensis]|uniref:family 4 glycosyl hydrolase n=1 Tax=Paenibacillus illinoisensis TaxID=59845 RepID=UPI000FDB2E27|nr:hypothetical protein [Paenibacillus illinoisensis]